MVYAILVATHLGEFWPFSIYPMFSQAGKPWSRTVVRDVSGAPSAQRWTTVGRSDLPGSAVPLAQYGIAPEDIANFVSKTKTWNTARLAGLQKVFTISQLGDRDLLVMKADGRLDENDTVSIQFTPYVWVNADTVLLNPTLAP
jgi:hypothetical protein